MNAPKIDEPLFFRDDVISDAEGRQWRVLDTPDRVRVAGSNKPAYIITSVDNVDLDGVSKHKIWIRDAREFENGRFTHEDGRGHPGGKAPVVIPIRGWAVSDWLDKAELVTNVVNVMDTGLFGLFVVIRKISDLRNAITALRETQEQYPEARLGLSVPKLPGVEILEAAQSAGLGVSWIQDCGVDVGLWDEQGKAIKAAYEAMENHILFAGVSFLDDDIDPDLAASVDAVQKAGMVPITSGLEHEMKAIRKRAKGGRLAFAGGLDPISVEPLLAYITDAIASNGISRDYYRLNRGKCRGFAESCKSRHIE